MIAEASNFAKRLVKVRKEEPLSRGSIVRIQDIGEYATKVMWFAMVDF
jgi:hypothetical protein